MESRYHPQRARQGSGICGTKQHREPLWPQVVGMDGELPSPGFLFHQGEQPRQFLLRLAQGEPGACAVHHQLRHPLYEKAREPCQFAELLEQMSPG